MDPIQSRRPPVLDMTPDGEFREPAAAGAPSGPPRQRGPLDRFLARLGVAALLVALAAAGLLTVAIALVFVGLLLPVVLIAGAVGAASLWWRVRRTLRDGGADRARRMHVVVMRR